MDLIHQTHHHHHIQRDLAATEMCVHKPSQTAAATDGRPRDHIISTARGEDSLAVVATAEECVLYYFGPPLPLTAREMISARSYIRTDVRCPKQIPEDHKLRRVGRDRAPTELHIRWCSGRGSTQLTPHSKQASDSSLVISVYSIRSDHRSSSRVALLLQLTSAAAFYL